MLGLVIVLFRHRNFLRSDQQLHIFDILHGDLLGDLVITTGRVEADGQRGPEIQIMKKGFRPAGAPNLLYQLRVDVDLRNVLIRSGESPGPYQVSSDFIILRRGPADQESVTSHTAQELGVFWWEQCQIDFTLRNTVIGPGTFLESLQLKYFRTLLPVRRVL